MNSVSFKGLFISKHADSNVPEEHFWIVLHFTIDAWIMHRLFIIRYINSFI